MSSTADLDRLAIVASLDSVERAYWLAQLAHPVKSGFPYDFPSEKDQHRMEEVRLQFAPEVVARLLELSNNSDVKLNMVLNAGAAALLYKYTGESDIITAAPIYRQQVESEFINTVLLLRNRLDTWMTFKELLREVRKTIADAAVHQNFPVLMLPMPGLLNLPGSISECPLFDVAVLLRNIHDYRYIAHTNHNVTFVFQRTGLMLEGVLQYNAQCFRRETMGFIGLRFCQLLENLIFNVDMELGHVDMLTAEERKTILEDFNDTTVDYPVDKTLHGLFAEQVERTPDHIVLVGADPRVCPISLSYHRLNEQSDRLAGLLIEKGVLPDDIVAIMIERSIEMIIGILGILKSGGAYLPVDPEYPQDRMDFMLRDSNSRVLVTSRDLNEKEIIINCQLLIVNCKLLIGRPHRGLHHTSFIDHRSNHLAYILYTSGSTGRPKGVLVDHSNVVANIFAFYREFGIGNQDCGLQLASSTFDLFAEEVYPLLLKGGKIVIPSREEMGDIQRLVELISLYGVTFVDTTPLILNEFNKKAEEISAQRSGCGITFISGGDVLKPGYVDRLVGIGRVYNTYGPTEATICAAYYRYKPGESGENIPIGKPIANYQIYILDRGGALQPVGLAGELCIAGVGVARGYLNNPELSAEKFIKNRSYWSYKTYIFYKTGDLARWLLDGNIEFLGRIDRQVKIRGIRIELGEIENRLTMHSQIKEAVVSVCSGTSEDRFLCAYVVCLKGFDQSPTLAEELKVHLSQTLPGYMIPTFFMVIEKIPLTANGKIDRAALPEPVITPGAKFAKPRNAVEEKIRAIWQELLGREGIGIDDDFFMLGGHSLKGIQMIDDLQAEFKVKIPLVELFNKRTIRGLAACIEKMASVPYCGIEPAEDREYYPLSPAQKRLYVLWQMDKTSTAYNMPQTAPVKMEKIDKHELEKIIKQLIRRHESFRTSFLTLGDEPVQRVYDNVDIAIEYYDLATDKRRSGQSRTFIRPFDLSKVPLLRVGLIKAEEGKYNLMMDMHHIISDDISHEILVRDFAALLRGEVLPHLEIQYKDYALWRNSPQQAAALEQQEQFWLKEFSGKIPLLNLPTDYPRRLNPDYEGSAVGFHLNTEEAAALKETAAACDATLYVTLVAIFSVFLARLCGQEDIIIGTPVSNRHFPELQFVIGMFIDTLVLRNYPAGEKTFSLFLQEVKERFLQAFENSGYPFETLVEKTLYEREPNRNPVFDVMFTFHTVEKSTGADDEEAAEFHYYERIAAKFDLTLIVVDNGSRISCNFRYSKMLFRREKIEKFAVWFKRIVAEVVQEPLIRLSEISLTSQQEKEGFLSQLEINLRE